MNKNDLDTLMYQLRTIIVNKPLSEDLKCESEELTDLQEAIFYLSNCLSESNEFLRALGSGNLDTIPPSRHNFLAGSLKELHSSLKHLTWQANQVALGDYNQQVHFLGDFSNSFNLMIQQLSERESQLKQQSAILADTVSLMKSIMDGLKDWVIVCAKETHEIIYANQSAQPLFYDLKTGELRCKESCVFAERLRKYEEHLGEQTLEFTCPIKEKTFRAQSFLVHWNGNLAYAHYIQDITEEREYLEMAYLDELTGLFNRRYFLDILDRYVEEKIGFCLCILDLDGLKYANDHFGHPSGDDYLKAVAQEMNRLFRGKKTCCRLGGDEFAILLPYSDMEKLEQRMPLLNQTLATFSSEYPRAVSYGCIQVDSSSTLSPEAIMAQADDQMYAAKNSKKRQSGNECF